MKDSRKKPLKSSTRPHSLNDVFMTRVLVELVRVIGYAFECTMIKLIDFNTIKTLQAYWEQTRTFS